MRPGPPSYPPVGSPHHKVSTCLAVEPIRNHSPAPGLAHRQKYAVPLLVAPFGQSTAGAHFAPHPPSLIRWLHTMLGASQDNFQVNCGRRPMNLSRVSG